jgi:hypothetical protein
MTVRIPKHIHPDDLEAMKKLAEDLRKESSANVRMAMQQKFVKDMAYTYGKEKAARMLTQVWQIVKTREEYDKQSF